MNTKRGGALASSDDILFNKRAVALGNTLMERKIRPAVAAAKIAKRVAWHVFRHSYATLLKGNGEDVKTVQESLRHSTVRLAMEVYAQAIPEHVRRAQERVSGQLVAAAGKVQSPVVVI
jgi:site-specific recombinase XerD